MHENLATIILVAGCCQLGVLIASSLVPLKLNWKTSLDVLPRLHRQLYWIYGSYVVLAIVNHEQLADGSRLSRFVCGYIAIFWGVRLSLQASLDVKEHLTTWWLAAGYHLLTSLFLGFTLVFGFAALHVR